MNRTIIFIILLFVYFLKAQSAESVRLLDDKTLIYQCTKELNPNNVITYLKELEKRNIGEDKLEGVYLSAGDAYSFLQDYEKAEYYFLKCYRLSKKSNNPYLSTIVLNLAATNYRLEKYPLSEKYFREYRNTFQSAPESPLSILTQMDYDRVYFLNGDFETYLAHLQKSYQYFLKQEEINQDPKLRPSFLTAKATILYTMANTATLVKDKALAEQYIDQARYILHHNQSLLSPLFDSYQMGQAYMAEINFAQLNNRQDDALLQCSKLFEYAESRNFKDYRFIALVEMATTLYDKKEYAEALKTSEKALNLKASTYDFFNYELEAYRMAYLCAKALGKDDDALRYAQSYLEKNHNFLNEKKRVVLSKILNDGEKFDIEKQLNKQHIHNVWMRWGLGSSGFVLAFLAAFIIYKNRMYRKNHRKFQEIISRYQNTESKEKLSVTREAPATKNKNGSVPETVPDQKTLEILDKLEDFEKTTVFTSQEMSAAYLATYLKTNTGTLSEVINKYKGSNFNDYINKLRVDYVIDKLRNEKKFRTYKISYLAEISGFSSHSLFSVVFKKRTGISPSKFIEFLEK